MEAQLRIDDYSRTARTAPSSDSVSAVCQGRSRGAKRKGEGDPWNVVCMTTGLVGG